MKISNSDDFTKGNIESSYFNLVWTNKVVVPNWRYYSFSLQGLPALQLIGLWWLQRD